MDESRLRALLDEVRAGATSVDSALSDLRQLPYADLGFAKVDHHRALRTGVPEVILAEPKTAEQVTAIALELSRRGGNVFITRLDADKARAVQEKLPAFRYAPAARTGLLQQTPVKPRGDARVAVISAGTGDQPVAEEAVETLGVLGIEALRVYDVGVAGLHRLLAQLPLLASVAGIIVVAGMEGALPSVVAGLVAAPIIAVPTSVGYGAHLAGMTPLCAMLTSCASGLSVVNIDNGFGAAMAMGRILPRTEET